MTKNEAIAWFGSQMKLATFLGVYQGNVSAWQKIPVHHQQSIEEHTNGELKADNSRMLVRYQCMIERQYMDLLRTLADRQSDSMVNIVRKALDHYASAMKNC